MNANGIESMATLLGVSGSKATNTAKNGEFSGENAGNSGFLAALATASTASDVSKDSRAPVPEMNAALAGPVKDSGVDLPVNDQELPAPDTAISSNLQDDTAIALGAPDFSLGDYATNTSSSYASADGDVVSIQTSPLKSHVQSAIATLLNHAPTESASEEVVFLAASSTSPSSAGHAAATSPAELVRSWRSVLEPGSVSAAREAASSSLPPVGAGEPPLVPVRLGISDIQLTAKTDAEIVDAQAQSLRANLSPNSVGVGGMAGVQGSIGEALSKWSAEGPANPLESKVSGSPALGELAENESLSREQLNKPAVAGDLRNPGADQASKTHLTFEIEQSGLSRQRIGADKLEPQAPLSHTDQTDGSDGLFDDLTPANGDRSQQSAREPSLVQPLLQNTVASRIDASTIPSAMRNALGSSSQFSDLSSAPQDAEFPSELLGRIRVLQHQGASEARLNLHPAELGRLQIHISTEGDQAKVAFTVDNPQAREAIEQALPRLREMLQQAGLQLADSDVSQQQWNDANSESSSSESDHQVAASTLPTDDQDAEGSDLDFDSPRHTESDGRTLDAYA